MKLINWVNDLINSRSPVSSKRVIAISLLIWGCLFGGFYIIKVQYNGKESLSTVQLVMAAFGSAVTIAVGGTAVENYKNKTKDNEN